MVDQLMDYSTQGTTISQEQLRGSNKNMLLCCCVGHVAYSNSKWGQDMDARIAGVEVSGRWAAV